MPLLLSPVSGEPMKQIVRNGIEIDVCPTSGGVSLDKGELEKLIALMSAAQEETHSRRYARRDHDDDDHDDDDHDDDDGDDRGRYRSRDRDEGPLGFMQGGNRNRSRERREGPLSNIMDIFEF